MENFKYIHDLADFMNKSVCNFWAVQTIKESLDANGFSQLNPAEAWALKPGDRRYIIKNHSSIFAFIIGNDDATNGFKIISAHSDSPGFRIKPNPEIVTEGGIVKLNTEVYGGPILYTWFDRPLSIAGRVILRSEDPLNPKTRLVKIGRSLLTIPHLAIHFNRAVNEGNHLSKQKDMLPVLGCINKLIDKEKYVLQLVASELSVDIDDIIDCDLMLYDTTKACLVGANNEFLTSGRLDDLSMAHAAMTALLESEGNRQTRIMAIFDNEETGSGTKQGAASPVLANILRRIVGCLGGGEEEYLRAIAKSFMISADNAHGIHPNYPEKHDPTNHPVLGGGPIIKINANCKYMTDADSAAVFKALCEKAGVPCQYFVNHSDSAGGSTLGNILTSQIDLRGVDMGNAMWAMHSVRETISTHDHLYAIKVFTCFYNC